MTGSPVAPEFSTWSAPGESFRIEYSSTVLDEIRMAAVEGYHRVPHGGVETGGILFGSRIRNGVRIKAWRPITCEYAKGPSFLLSDHDEAVLTETLKSSRDDADLAGMEPAGWYRAHTRSEILLSDSDLAFFNRFFPQPWQVALIVRPASFAPTRAGFFFREPDGAIRTQSSYREFILVPMAVAVPNREPAPVEPEPQSEPVPPQAAAVPQPEPEPPPAIEYPTPPVVLRRPLPPEAVPDPDTRRKWYAVGLLGVIVIAIGFWLLKPSHQRLALSATDLGGQLQIAWDRAARPLSHATGGSIEIDDHGVRTQVKLTPADLRSGSVYYARQSGDVAVRMTVDVPGVQPVTEMTRFLRPSQVPAPPAEQTAQPATRTAPVQTATRPAQGEPPPVVVQKPAPVPAARRVVAFQPPVTAPRQTSTAIPSVPPPSINSLPAAPQGGALTSVLGSSPTPPPAPAPVAPAAPKTTAPPASGRIIWTGKFPKNGRLVVEGNRASFGAVSGTLPAGPVRVSAYPGDLTPGGITLFTADPRYSTPATEAAGAGNGWNTTTYTWDTKRAAGIKVVEQPTPQNGYKLVLQSDATKLSVVVLEWHAAR